MTTFSKEVRMRKAQAIVVVAVLLFALAAGAEDKQTPKVMNKVEPLPRDLEIQLALSALPPHLRDNATVYTLNPDKGFEVARKGTNGFHALKRIGIIEPSQIPFQPRARCSALRR